ncbi:MAG: MFS transporter [Oligoflexales bacterium]
MKWESKDKVVGVQISQSESNRTNQVLHLLGLSFFDMLSYAMLGPILTLLFLDGPHSIFVSSGSKHFLFGLYLSLFSFVQIFSVPFWGRLSLKISKKQVLKFTFFGNAIAYAIGFLGVFYGQVILLFIGVLVAGLTCANIPMINSLIAENTPEKKWTEYFSLLGASIGLAFVIGPQISALFMKTLPAKTIGLASFAICAVTSLLICFYVHFFLQDEKLPNKDVLGAKLSLHLSNICKGDRDIKKILCFQFCISLAWYFFIKFFQVYLIEAKCFGEIDSCHGISYLGLCCCFWQGIRYLKELSFRGGKSNFVFLVALMGASIIGFLMVDKFFAIMVLIVLLSFSYSMIVPASVSLLLNKGTDAKEMKTAWFQCVQCIAKVLAPLLSGYLFTKSSDASAYLACLALLFAAILLLSNPRSFLRIQNKL